MDYWRSERGKAEPRLREDTETRGAYLHSPGNGSSGGVHLGGVIALDVGDATDPYNDAKPTNLNDFMLDWEDFAAEVVGQIRQDARDKWACRTFPRRLPLELKADLGIKFGRRGSVQGSNASMGWSKKKLQAKGWTTFGRYP